VLLALLIAPTVLAGPWMPPGDTALRHDVMLLADAGALPVPVTTWPLAWGDVAGALDDRGVELSPDEAAAYARLTRRIAEATRTGEGTLRLHAALAGNPREIRAFEDGPRDEGEVGFSLDWTGDWLAFNLAGEWLNDPEDRKDWRLDGSYFGLALGNWMLSAGAMDRWWGPGWQGSLILGNNARPIPALALERNSTQAFESKWLSWIGPWDLAVVWGFLEDDRAVPDARFFGLRVNFRPLKTLEIGISRTALWCGRGQSCGSGAFSDMLFRGDEPGSNPDQLGGFDVRWSGALFDMPIALYAQMIGEDEANGLPSDWLGQFGAETWGRLRDVGSYRLYLEWADTECDFRFYRSIRSDGGPGSPGCAYSNSVYRTGQHYRGRSFAHSIDGDSSVFAAGGMLTDTRGRSWLMTAAAGNLNRRNAGSSALAGNKTRYRELELVHKRALLLGELDVGVGYASLEDTVTDDTDDDFRAFIGWSFIY